MANKTMKFYGVGYAPTGETATISVAFDGNTVFTGSIPTLAMTEPTPDPTQYDVLFTQEVDGNLVATVPMGITLTGGLGFTIGRVEVNNVGNNVGNVYQLMCSTEYPDCRTNVEINGVAQSKGPLADVLVGPWSWNVFDGTITYDLNIVDPFV